MENSDNRLTSVNWSEICPWLIIFRTFRIASGFRILLLSAVAIILTAIGFALLGYFFADSLPATPDSTACPCKSALQLQPCLGPAEEFCNATCYPIFFPGTQFSQPFIRLFDLEADAGDMSYALLFGLWTLAVWALIGGAITRSAAVQLATGERIGWSKMFVHANRRWLSYFWAPLVPLVGVLLLSVPIALLGLFLRFNAGILLVALLWPLFIFAGLVMATLLLGLIFGWPLMWAAISVEKTDCFDALSRSYAYVFQRPLRYLFYVVIATIFGSLCWLLVSNFAAAVAYLPYWSTSWGGGQEQLNLILQRSPELGSLGKFGATMIHTWTMCVQLLAAGFLYGYFWTATTAIYFLLRQDVDATEMDEVELDEEAEYGLPRVETDDIGAPVVTGESEQSAEGEADEKSERKEES